MKSKLLKLKKPIIKITVSFILIIALFLSIDRSALFESLEVFNFSYVPLIILLIVLNYVISSIRWKYLVSIYPNSEKAGTLYLIGLYFIGSFFNNFMPTSIGGDVYKIVKLGNRISSKPHAFSATFMERFTGVIALAFISVLGFLVTVVRGYSGFEDDFLTLGVITVVLIIGFFVGGFVGLKLLYVLKNKIKKIEKIYDSLSLYKGKNKVLFYALLGSFIVQFCSIFTQYYIVAALGAHLDVFRVLFIIPLITLASFFIPSLNGIGVQDFLYKFSNVFLLMTEPVAVAGSILYHIFRLIVSIFGGILYAMGKSD